MKKKKIISVLAFLIMSKCFSQQKDKEHYIAFSTAIDIRNLILGTEATKYKNVADLFFQVSIISPSGVEINIGYETHKRLDFDKYTMGVGYLFPLYGYLGNRQIKTLLIPSLEPTLINRYGTWGGGLSYNEPSSHLSLGANVALRVNINDKIAIEYLFNALPRIDLNAKYTSESWKNKSTIGGVPIVSSNFIKIIYKIQRGL